MHKLKVYPSKLNGAVSIPASKSAAHRHLICAALADEPSVLTLDGLSDDILATIGCLTALGAEIRVIRDMFSVDPIPRNRPVRAVLHCGESGSTLRFMLPVAAALGIETVFTGKGRLPERPNAPLLSQLRKHGVKASEGFPISICGKLTPGEYVLPGDISSQYVTGLLFALSLLDGESELRLSTAPQSAGYIDLTLDVLAEYGVSLKRDGALFSIKPSRFAGGNRRVEGDWSNAAFWLCAAVLGHSVSVGGLNGSSTQGDRGIVRILDRFRLADGLRGIEIDAGPIPDLVPVLAVVATQAQGETRIYNAARLRDKESDRLAAMRINLAILGADVRETDDGLLVRGKKPLTGGRVDAFNDHRIAMSMAIAATVADAPIEIMGADSVKKSYPGFFDDYAALGGKIDRSL